MKNNVREKPAVPLKSGSKNRKNISKEARKNSILCQIIWKRDDEVQIVEREHICRVRKLK